MSRISALCGATLLATILAGCSNGPFAAWHNDGWMKQQQVSAERFDPYTDNDVGPEVVGGRPREFAEPVAEPSRARWDPNEWNRRHGAGY